MEIFWGVGVVNLFAAGVYRVGIGISSRRTKWQLQNAAPSSCSCSFHAICITAARVLGNSMPYARARLYVALANEATERTTLLTNS